MFGARSGAHLVDRNGKPRDAVVVLVGALKRSAGVLNGAPKTGRETVSADGALVALRAVITDFLIQIGLWPVVSASERRITALLRVDNHEHVRHVVEHLILVGELLRGKDNGADTRVQQVQLDIVRIVVDRGGRHDLTVVQDQERGVEGGDRNAEGQLDGDFRRGDVEVLCGQDPGEEGLHYVVRRDRVVHLRHDKHGVCDRGTRNGQGEGAGV